MAKDPVSRETAGQKRRLRRHLFLEDLRLSPEEEGAIQDTLGLTRNISCSVQMSRTNLLQM